MSRSRKSDPFQLALNFNAKRVGESATRLRKRVAQLWHTMDADKIAKRLHCTPWQVYQAARYMGKYAAKKCAPYESREHTPEEITAMVEARIRNRIYRERMGFPPASKECEEAIMLNVLYRMRKSKDDDRFKELAGNMWRERRNIVEWEICSGTYSMSDNYLTEVLRLAA